jgi:hypothetical protein
METVCEARLREGNRDRAACACPRTTAGEFGGSSARRPVLLCLILAVMTLGSRILRCPSCGSSWREPLFSAVASYLRPKCQHCGLVKWEGFSKAAVVRHRVLIGWLRLVSGLALGAAVGISFVTSEVLALSWWLVLLLALECLGLAVFGPDGWWQAKVGPFPTTVAAR